MSDRPAFNSILIVGAGVFGLSTALALLKRPHYASASVIILDSSPTLPNPSGSSVDASRIIRADYSNPIYARLAAQAQVLWRDTSDGGWGGQGRYHEPGFVLTMNSDSQTEDYLKKSLSNTKRLAEESIHEVGGVGMLKPIEALQGQEEIKKATGYEHASGNAGYVNWNSGWADAEKSVAYALRRLEGEDRVRIRSGAKVNKVIVENGKCVGVKLEGGEQIRADLTILAAGAWTPSLINLQGRCLATGQVMAYIDISDEEQKELEHRPTVMNMSRGMFIIPPRDNQLKVARHGYGYRNLKPISGDALLNSDSQDILQVSVPRVEIEVPKEGQDACRDALRELLPGMGDRPFARTRICWYCDTPDGDFLIDHHPHTESLFFATGGSGHGFKFFPIIGDKIMDAVERRLEPDLKRSWQWREQAVPNFVGCDDGSHAGRKGMILEEEMARL